MKANTYVDYRLRVPFKADMGEVARAASSLMRGLHAGLSELSEKQFALAFPHFESASPQKKLTVFRVFAESTDDQMELHQFMSKHPKFGATFSADFPMMVPSEFAGPYKAFSRLRIRTRERSVTRLKQMLAVNEQGNLWIDMASKENGHRFRFYVQATEGAPGETGELNSYGLSNAEQLVYLPVI